MLLHIVQQNYDTELISRVQYKLNGLNYLLLFLGLGLYNSSLDLDNLILLFKIRLLHYHLFIEDIFYIG